MNKTNAMRLLDAAGIEYQAKEYEYDEADLSGTHAAAALDMPPEQMFKTLVARGEKKGVLVFCIPVDQELDLKKAATAAKCKKVDMLPMKELLSVTGYIRGGCSPVGMKKKYETYIDETAQLFEIIGVSAGQRGLQMTLEPDALAGYVGGEYYDLCK